MNNYTKSKALNTNEKSTLLSEQVSLDDVKAAVETTNKSQELYNENRSKRNKLIYLYIKQHPETNAYTLFREIGITPATIYDIVAKEERKHEESK